MILGFKSQEYFDRTAIILADGSSLSYAKLHEAVAFLAPYLPRRQLIFLLGENDLPSLICYLAALEVGAVPLLLSAKIAQPQLMRLIECHDPGFIFMRSATENCANQWIELLEQDGYALYQRPQACSAVLHKDLALLLATSGSTGSPKLVRLTGDNLTANAASIITYLGIEARDRAISSLPMHYSYGLSVINSHLQAGASVVLTSRSMMDPIFWKLMNECAVSTLAGVPYSFEMLLKLRLGNMNLSSLRKITQAGGRLDPEKIQQVYAICKAKGIDFYVMYGQTEATARIAYMLPVDTLRKLGSIGRAIPGGGLWVEDHQGHRVTTPGVLGELVYTGPNVSMGYAEQAEDLKLGDINKGILHTGDLARFDEEGFFFIEGRLRRFLKIFGLRISLDAVEQIVLEQGMVCAAHGRDDHLVVHVVENGQLCTNVMRQEMARTLGVHSSAIVVKILPELPRLPSGKVDYQCLTQLS